MIRWRLGLALAMLLLLPVLSGKRDADDDDDEKNDDNEEEEEEEDEEEEEEEHEKNVIGPVKRLGAPIMTSLKPAGTLTRTTKRRPLECYVCAFKSETPLRACLDPTKYRVHTITCHSIDDKCFTSVVTKGSSYEAVVRGCRSGCLGAPDTTCCETNRCNSQAFAMPIVQPKVMMTANKSDKTIPPSIFFFVTILLLLQTVVKVPFV